jgi:hypothetical protein
MLSFAQGSMATDGRTDKLGPWEDGVEVIADTGYGHTLFDSADNKCQHCHNDLYDTWKTSMHAKSWVDPIFQVKYQDFLRLQASKIGATGPGGKYKKGMIQKTGQVCIKCHAPTAFYSGDYKITLTEVGDQNMDSNAYADAKSKYEENLAGGSPPYKANKEATVVSLARTGKVYSVSYQIGHEHNQEGINCAFCHSIETVRMFNDIDGDMGQYTLANDMKMGPIGPIVRPKGDMLSYSPDASTPDMNAFFALIGPDKGNVENTVKEKEDFPAWDENKSHDGRYVIKSTKTGCETEDTEGNCVGTVGYYTGGPFYGPFGVTGLSNSRGDDISMREWLVKPDFVAAVGELPDKFEDPHQFAAYGKALCLSCHQRSSLMLNPESDADPGIEVVDGVHVGDDQFLELCSTWTAMSDGVGNNFEDTATSPKCQRCHMEPLTTIDGKAAVVLHQWDRPDLLFTEDDVEHLTYPFVPDNNPPYGPVSEGYLNNHAFMGANTKDFGTTKIETGFEADMEVKFNKGKKLLTVETYLQNKTAHMFPGAHPMRRVWTRLVLFDKNGNMLPFRQAKAESTFNDITNQVAVLDGNEIKDGFETVEVAYNKHADVVIQGYTPDFTGKKHVSSQYMDSTEVDWVSPDGTVRNSAPVCTTGEFDSAGKCTGPWAIKGKTTVKKVTDIDGRADHFTRIYGRETGKRAPDGTHVVRPGFDSNIAADNRLKPNEMEKYTIKYDTKKAAFPLKAEFRVYYLKKGGNGKTPIVEDPDDEDYGFLDTANPKDAIFKVFGRDVQID